MAKPTRRAAKAAQLVPVVAAPSAAAAADPHNPLGLPGPLDPADYDWHPVARRKREDGWTHTRQRKFIEVLADTGSVNEAAKAVNMAKQSCYRLRRSPGAEAFARAWDAAIEEASRRLVDVAFERAFQGVADPVFDKEGACIAVRRKYNDRLLMFLLRAHQPERYRYAHGDLRRSGEPPRSAPEPVAAAIDLLGPPVPADPAALVPPEELEERLMIAETLDGKLPGWLEDRGGDRDLDPQQVAPDIDQQLKRIMRADQGLRNPDPDREQLERRSHLL